ncbi:hypothetical protein ACTXT7_017199, partial [Hymenolepis weldensis]
MTCQRSGVRFQSARTQWAKWPIALVKSGHSLPKKGSAIGNTHEPTLGAASYEHTSFPPLQDADIFSIEEHIFVELTRGNLDELTMLYLKKLGRFLGLVTLTQNRIVFDKDLDMKAFLYDAILEGKDVLLYVLAFMTQFLKGLN